MHKQMVTPATFHFIRLSLASVIALLSLFFFYPMHAAAVYSTNPTEAIGEIEKPVATKYYAPTVENQLPRFISTMLTMVAVAMGLWVLINIILAGYISLTSNGDPQSMTKVRTSITNSFIGLLLIVLAYTLAALAGTIFFGDAQLFINPTIPIPTL